MPTAVVRIPDKFDTIKRIFPYLIFLIVCLLIFQPIVSNDTFWILNTGKYIVQHGFPTTDPFTNHWDLQITVQQWLSDVIYWFVNDWFGFNMLFVFSFSCYFFICCLIYVISLRISNNNRIISFFITILAELYLSTCIEIRPQILSGLIFGLEIYILELYLIKRKVGYLFLLPILSLLLVNLHAALWLFFFLLFIPYILDGFKITIWSFKTQGYKTGPLIITFIASFAAGIINPYGLNNMFYLFYSYLPNSVLRKPIVELLPPFIDEPSGILFYAYLSAMILTYMLVKSNTRWRYALITFGIIYISLSSRRNILLFLVCALPLLSYYLRDIHFPATQILWKKRLIITSFIIITAVMYLFSNHHPYIPGDIAPKEAVNFIYKHQELFKNYRLYNEFNTGGYLEFCGIRTFIDSREEVFLKSLNKKEDILLFYDRVISGAGIHYKEFIEKYQLTHFLVPKYGTFDIYLNADPEYKKLYEDQLFAIYCHK